MIYERFATTILNASNVGIPVPGGGNDQTVIRSIMYPVYFWAGVIAVVVIIAAGFFYVTSSPEPKPASHPIRQTDREGSATTERIWS